MNNSVIIQARMGSKRLPGKSIAQLGDFKVIEWIFQRLKLCNKIDNFILATTEEKDDDILCEIAKDNSVDYYRGSKNDVLKRYIDSSKHYKVENVIRVCADRPFVDPRLIDHLVENFDPSQTHLLYNHKSDDTNYWPIGFGAEIFRSKILEEIYEKKLNDEFKEHVTLYLYNNNMYKTTCLDSDCNINDINKYGKFDLDTQSDFLKLEKIAKSISIDDYFLKIIENLNLEKK
jgi:spore coat polysaccharide biosynthesis protein SpsF